MSASRVATAVTMNAEGIKFGVQQANDSLKKLVTVSKQTDNSLKTLKFLAVWRSSFSVANLAIETVMGTFNKLVRAISNPIAELPFVNVMKQFIDKTVEAAEVQRNLATALGVSMTQFAGLRLAAETTGVSLTQLYEPISKLPRKIDDALRGLSDALTTFQRLPGVDLNKLGAAKPFDQFQIVIDAINKIPNIGERFAVINKIFEESGLKFRQFFATGSAGLKEFMQLAKDLKLVPSKDDLAAIRLVKQELIIIGQQWEAIARDVLIQISPDLIAFLKTVRDYLSDPKLRDNLIKGVASAFLEFGKAVLAFTDAIIEIGKFIKGIYDFFAKDKLDAPSQKVGRGMSAVGVYGGAPLIPALQEGGRKLGLGEAGVSEKNKKAQEEAGLLGGDFFKTWEKQRKKIQVDLDKQKRILEETQNVNGETTRQAQQAVDKVVETVKYTIKSNAASGAAPGKLSGADINTSAGLEMFLKSFEPGYGEDKQVTVLKEIKKEIIKGNQQQDKTAELAGAT